MLIFEEKDRISIEQVFMQFNIDYNHIPKYAEAKKIA